MTAFLIRKYDKGFFITEEALVRIEDMIRKRVPTLSSGAVEFRVIRKDGLSASYTSPSVLSNDSSVRFSPIEELNVVTDHNDLKMALRFSREIGASVRLEAQDRDTAFLISSDLKEYLQADVLRGTLINLLAIPRTILLPLASLAGIVPVLYLLGRSTRIPYETALMSKDVNTKLDYIIEKNGQVSFSSVSIPTLVPIGLILLIYAISRMVIYLYPRNTFYFGKEIDHYDRVKDLRSKIVWVVLVGVVVSIVAALITSKVGIG